MRSREFLIDPSLYDINHIIADTQEIRKYNQQRYEMEQLTAIVYDNEENTCCVGYKDVTEQEFWIRGHMPSFPLMPGVIMCEAAAQLASYYVSKHGIMENCILGFAGLEDVRFRGILTPNNRFLVQAKMLHCRKKLISARFQGIVNDKIIVEGVVKGVPLDVNNLNSVR